MKRFGLARILFELALILLVTILASRRPSPGLSWRDRVVHLVHTNEKVVALTFDDGPHPLFTPGILRILDRYHVKATFFMVGDWMEKYPDIVRQVLARGHAIGNHTYTHPRNLEAESAAQVIRELDRCEQTIETITGKRTRLFRPPRGFVNETVLMIAQEEGYRTILWTVCADHHDAPTPQLMAKRVVDRIQPGGIILAHDGRLGIRWKDVAATPLIIQALRKRGYHFVTVPELLERDSWRRRFLLNWQTLAPTSCLPTRGGMPALLLAAEIFRTRMVKTVWA